MKKREISQQDLQKSQPHAVICSSDSNSKRETSAQRENVPCNIVFFNEEKRKSPFEKRLTVDHDARKSLYFDVCGDEKLLEFEKERVINL